MRERRAQEQGGGSQEPRLAHRTASLLGSGCGVFAAIVCAPAYSSGICAEDHQRNCFTLLLGAKSCVALLLARILRFVQW